MVYRLPEHHLAGQLQLIRDKFLELSVVIFLKGLEYQHNDLEVFLKFFVIVQAISNFINPRQSPFLLNLHKERSFQPDAKDPRRLIKSSKSPFARIVIFLPFLVVGVHNHPLVFVKSHRLYRFSKRSCIDVASIRGNSPLTFDLHARNNYSLDISAASLLIDLHYPWLVVQVSHQLLLDLLPLQRADFDYF